MTRRVGASSSRPEGKCWRKLIAKGGKKSCITSWSFRLNCDALASPWKLLVPLRARWQTRLTVSRQSSILQTRYGWNTRSTLLSHCAPRRVLWVALYLAGAANVEREQSEISLQRFLSFLLPT